MAYIDKETREKLAKQGKAMEGGKFPIRGEQDLHDAIRVAGNASDPKKARRFIMKRAKALGLTKQIPDTWASDGSLKG